MEEISRITLIHCGATATNIAKVLTVREKNGDFMLHFLWQRKKFMPLFLTWCYLIDRH